MPLLSPAPEAARPALTSLLACPDCHASLSVIHTELVCGGCGARFAILNGKPIFTPVVDIVQPPEKIERGPNQGTPWRRANWRFLADLAARISPASLVLDVGSGMGDFAQIFAQHAYYTLDVVAHPEVDIVCDLVQRVPFREGAWDVILVMNVVEHIFATRDFFRSLAYALKPGGSLVIAVPFMMKVHMAPYDFHRYTHFALAELGREAGLQVSLLEGYYDPAFLMGESARSVRHWELSKLSRVRRTAARLLLAGVEALTAGLARVLPAGHLAAPEREKNPSAVGYHLILTKPAPMSQP